MRERQIVVIDLSDEDRLAGHIPDEIYRMSRDHDVFYEDRKTSELVQVLDLTEDEDDS